MKLLAKKLWNNEFYQGGFLLTVSSFIVSILNYFYHLLIGRNLGPSGYGEIASLFSYISILSVPITVLTLIIIQKISSTSYSAIDYTITLEEYFWSKVKKWWYLIIPVLFIIPFMPRITNLSPVTSFILIPFAVLTFLASFYAAALQGLKLFVYFFYLNILVAVIKLSGAFLTFSPIGDINIVLVFLLLATMVGLAYSFYLIRKRAAKEKKIVKGTINKRLMDIVLSSHMIITTVSTLGITAFSNVDIIFVKKFFDPVDSGIYSSWSLFAKIILYFIGPLLSISYIFFASQKKEKEQNRVLFISLGLLFLIGICSYLVYKLFGNQVVYLFFGNKYEKVIPLLSSASIFGIFYTAITLINNYFLAIKSKLSLILPICMPLYIIILFFVNKQLQTVITVNIVVSIFIFFIYFFSWIKSYLKNNTIKTI